MDAVTDRYTDGDKERWLDRQKARRKEK